MDFSSLNDDQLYALTQQAFGEAALRRWQKRGELADLDEAELAELGRLTWAEAETRGLAGDFETLLRGEVARIDAEGEADAAEEAAQAAKRTSRAQQRSHKTRSTRVSPSVGGGFFAEVIFKALVLILVTTAYFVLGDFFLQMTTGQGFVENLNQLPTVFSE